MSSNQPESRSQTRSAPQTGFGDEESLQSEPDVEDETEESEPFRLLCTLMVVAALCSCALALGYPRLNPTPQGQMLELQAQVAVWGHAMRVKASYLFASQGGSDWLPDLYLHHPPGPVRDLKIVGQLGEATMRPLLLDSQKEAVHVIFAPIPPKRQFTVHATFAHSDLGQGGVCYTSLARYYGQPLQKLEVDLVLPRTRKLSQCTYRIHDHSDEPGRRVYRIRLQDYLPREDLMFHWTEVPADD